MNRAKGFHRRFDRECRRQLTLNQISRLRDEVREIEQNTLIMQVVEKYNYARSQIGRLIERLKNEYFFTCFLLQYFVGYCYFFNSNIR